MKINLHSPIEEVQVQIIPLIDVIFCILTFFLLAALQFTRQQAISVDLPKATTGTTPQAQQQRVIVTLDSVGQIYVEQQPVRLDQLFQTLQTYVQANPTGILVLNASRSSSYNDVIQVLDAMREVGGDRVALATVSGSPIDLLARHPYPAVFQAIRLIPWVPLPQLVLLVNFPFPPRLGNPQRDKAVAPLIPTLFQSFLHHLQANLTSEISGIFSQFVDAKLQLCQLIY